MDDPIEMALRPTKTQTEQAVDPIEQALNPANAAPKVAQGTTVPSAEQHLGTAGNVGMGALSGASKIGATVLSPFQAAILAQAREENPDLAPEYANQTPSTRKDLETFFQQNADPNSLAFKGGELGSEIAGTAGIGGALGAGAKALGASPAVVSALGSGGLSTGKAALPIAENLAIRTGAGAVTGAASAGLVNPDQAAAGGAIGAITPGAAWLAGIAGKAIFNGAGMLTRNALGASTGAGSTAIQAAYDAGKVGDSTFLDNMRGNASMGDIVEQAKDALGQMRAARGAAYREGMAQVSQDATALDMKPIQDAVTNLQNMGNYKGFVTNKNASGTVQEISDTVNDFMNKIPAEQRTPEALDALKQSIGDIRDASQYGTPQRVAADRIYNAVKGEIVKQAPVYAKVMDDYSTASEQLNEIQKSLSLGNKASADTALRKLQSVLRNNVNTNYGNRMTMVNALQEQGGANIVPALAGQALNTWIPRGIQGALEGAGAGPLALVAPKALLAAPVTSPRLVGESAYALGNLVGKGGNVAGKAAGNVAPLIANPNAPLYLREMYQNGSLPVKTP